MLFGLIIIIIIIRRRFVRRHNMSVKSLHVSWLTCHDIDADMNVVGVWLCVRHHWLKMANTVIVPRTTLAVDSSLSIVIRPSMAVTSMSSTQKLVTLLHWLLIVVQDTLDQQSYCVLCSVCVYWSLLSVSHLVTYTHRWFCTLLCHSLCHHNLHSCWRIVVIRLLCIQQRTS